MAEETKTSVKSPSFAKATEDMETKTEQKKKVNLKYQRDKDREMVKGIFRFYEVPGGTLSFVYRQYKEDPVERYDMEDGHIYTVPLGVARHLNKNCWYPVHAYKQNETGGQDMLIGQKVRRCGFQSLEFVDIDDITMTGESPIIEQVTLR
jgi:hypothetical protein